MKKKENIGNEEEVKTELNEEETSTKEEEKVKDNTDLIKKDSEDYLDPRDRYSESSLFLGIFRQDPTKCTPEKRVLLPSRGNMYGGKLKDGYVTIRAMTTREEKLIMGGSRSNKAIEVILDRCVNLSDTGLKTGELTVQDRLYLLMMIRSISYGPEYGFMVKCNWCGLRVRHEILIPDHLEVRYLKPEAKEPFKVHLPFQNIDVEYTMLRGYDEDEITLQTEREYQGRGAMDGDPGYIFRMAKQISRINGQELGPHDKLRLVENLIGADSLELRNSMEYTDFGINLDCVMDCPRCGGNIEFIMPFTTEFFRPRR